MTLVSWSDGIRSIGGEVYYPHEVDVLGDRRDFSMHIDAAQIGPVMLGWLSYDTEVQISTAPLETAYEVNIPVLGQFETGSGVDRIVATPSRAAVYRCDRGTVMRGWGDERCRLLAVKILRPALEEQLGNLLNRPLSTPVQFALPLDLTDTKARQWWSLVEVLAHQLENPAALGRHPLLANNLSQGIMIGLLLAARHDYSAELDAAAEPARPATVRRAIDYIEGHIDDVLTIATIANHVGVGVRTLQQGFQDSLGTTPMRYLRHARLRRARQDLLRADPDNEGVAQIAYRWGFGHLGRFAQQYREAFGESPSAALHATHTVADSIRMLKTSSSQ